LNKKGIFLQNGDRMGQLKRIKETIRTENVIPNQLIKEIPIEIQESLEKFQPHSFDLKNIVKTYHDDKRSIVTSGAYVPIPFILMMLPIFTGGKITDTRDHLDRTLNISGNKSGVMNVYGEALSSDLCFYVFSFLMQMAIYHNTTLLHVNTAYLLEFLGWKNTSINIEKINVILEKLYSVEYGGTYGGLFKNINKKKEERYNIFSGRLVDGYYTEKTGFIINISPTILKLFAFEKIWYGLNLESYSKIPTGHCKSLFIYIGAKARGANSIDINLSEVFERMSLTTIKTNKQKSKIVKESLDILKSLSIINDYSINGHFITDKNIHIVFSKKKESRKSFFDLEHLEQHKSYSSISCHSHHNSLININVNIKTIHSKILRIFNFKEFVSDYNTANISNTIKAKDYGFLKNVYEDDNRKIQIELKKIENSNKIRNWLNSDGLTLDSADINKQIVFEKPRKIKEIKQNIEVLHSSGNNIYNSVISDAKEYLNMQKENFNNQEKLVSGFLVRQTESTSALAEEIKDKLNNSNIESSVKNEIYQTLFNYIDNISVGLTDDLKESKIPYQIYSDGTLKIKTINDNNFSKIDFDCDLRSLINKMKDEKVAFLNDELEKGKISEYDYKNKLNSNKAYYKNSEQKDKELVEGHKVFWWQTKIDNISRTHKYSHYDNEVYNKSLKNYRVNDTEHHKAFLATIISKEKINEDNKRKYNSDIFDVYIKSVLNEKEFDIEIYEKLPLITKDNKEVQISSSKLFEEYLKNHNLYIDFKDDKGFVKMVLQESDDECKPIKYLPKKKEVLNDYKKEYMNIYSNVLKRESDDTEDDYLDMPKFTLSESKRIKELEQEKQIYIDYIEKEIESKNTIIPENSSKFDFDELLDEDNIFQYY
jgi:hypothetical protein